ncbi:hypothetical protein [Hymenobacter volaticus]|uniref:Uncharacterized protein n=1 Tax=Hymenobacter volaticus TaxID=2932254 RepID=A0ABY4G8U6_9BACT|nr:hypothetical protein [Hymenobacter volaticus]UOQ67326.1 hypothetical protein MUN86_05440 [Hymenobacter volaticus]
MVTCICRLLLALSLVVSSAFASFEAVAITPVFRLLPRMPLKTVNRFPLCLHHSSCRAYK